MSSNNVGYWYKDNTLYELSGQTHIEFILDNTNLFNITKDYIQSIYDKYGETLKVEGKAREQIIKEVLISSNWFRIRHYLKPTDYWSIQCGSLRSQKRDVRELVEYMVLDKDIMNKNASVVFLGLKDNTREEYNYMTGGIMKFLQETSMVKRKPSNIRLYRKSFLESEFSAEEYLNNSIVETSRYTDITLLTFVKKWWEQNSSKYSITDYNKDLLDALLTDTDAIHEIYYYLEDNNLLEYLANNKNLTSSKLGILFTLASSTKYKRVQEIIKIIFVKPSKEGVKTGNIDYASIADIFTDLFKDYLSFSN